MFFLYFRLAIYPTSQCLDMCDAEIVCSKTLILLNLSYYGFGKKIINCFYLQDAEVTLVTFCEAEVDGFFIFSCVANAIGQFKPQMLAYLHDIVEVDITGCVDIDPDDFTDFIQSCSKLRFLYMSGCYQFQKAHIVEFMQNLPNIQTIDVTECSKLDYQSIYELLEVLFNLKIFHFDPEEILSSRFKWRQLVKDAFVRVEFSQSLIMHFPSFNDNRRLAQGLSEE